MRSLTFAVFSGGLVVLSASGAEAKERAARAVAMSTPVGPGTSEVDEPRRSAASTDPFGYVHAFTALSLGRGLRFNNPYRLQTELGDDAESLSLTATYFDLGLGATLGDPKGLQHGAVAHLSFALDGISQEVASLSYLLASPIGRDFMLGVRAGFPVVLEPDLGVGLELGASGTWLLSGGIGISAELVSSLFFGAATWENDPTLFPVLSFQIGAYAEYEVLP